MTKKDIIDRMIALGSACLNRDMQDSHSGNIAARWTNEEGTSCLAVTRTGSQKGGLERGDICFPAMAETDFGHYRASSETTIHARILQIEGAVASMHAHTKHAVVATMGPAGKSGPHPPLVPIDSLGRSFLEGSVPVHRFAVPSGSPEMAKVIPEYLEKHPTMIVQNHGAFARGRCLEHAFFRLCLVENSGYTIQLARRFGADAALMNREQEAAGDGFFGLELRAGLGAAGDYDCEGLGRCDFDDEPQTRREFLKTGHRIFEQGLSPFHTGSASIRCADTMLYTPAASMPSGLPGPLVEIPLVDDVDESFPLSIHRYIFNNSNFQTVIHTFTPETDAAVLYRHPGEAEPPDRIIPVDAEASFLYPAIPVLPAGTEPGKLLETLHDYNVAVVRRGGVWAVGEQSLSEALHHNSSVRDICLYRLGALDRGLDLAELEPEKARKW